MAYNKLEYKKYRARTPIKTFRDLDVYKNTTLLSAEVFDLKLPEKYRKKPGLQEELLKLKELSRLVPRFIAEGHSKKFESLAAGLARLETAAETVNLIISKIDFLGAVVENNDFKQPLLEFIKKYQIQKRKILNLKRAWQRVFGSGDFKKGWKKQRNIKKKYKK